VTLEYEELATHTRIAEQILSKYSLATLEKTEEVLVYQDGIYVPAEGLIKAKVEEIEPNATSSLVNEVIGHIQRRTYVKREEFDSDIHIINLQNGLYNLKTREFMPHTHEYLSRVQLPLNYEPSAKCPNFLKFLRQVMPDHDDGRLLLEEFASCLWRSANLQLAYMHVGKGANGKSTLFKVMEVLFGKQNISHESIHNLAWNRFAAAELDGKLANIHADISNTEIAHTGILKQVISGDPITVEKKHKDPFALESYAKHFFSCNDLPQVYDSSDAWFRRWIIIEWKEQFTGDKADKNIIETLTTEEELSGILNILLGITRKLIQKGKLSANKTTEQIRLEWQERADLVQAFINNNIQKDANNYITKEELYSRYVQWCNSHNYASKSQKSFSERVKQLLPVEETTPKVAGKRVRAWKGIQFKEIKQP
jgi:putative DNA primase/helicase